MWEQKMNKTTLGLGLPETPGSKSITIDQKDLGVNCWHPVRFLGGKCWMGRRCKYPEKKTCKAEIHTRKKEVIKVCDL